MNPTSRFFSSLRKLAVTLETETNKLQDNYQTRNNQDEDEEDSDSTVKAIRAYHEVNCDVRNLKGQIQGEVAQQKAQVNEVSSFIKACRVTEQRVTKDIQTLKGHWEKYGYKAPQDTQRPTKAKDQESEDEDEEAADENETKSAGGEEEGGSQEEAGVSHSLSSPTAKPPPFTDVMHTPQLSDFGLCEMAMKRALAGVGWCPEVPPMPKLSIPHPTLTTPAPPPMPLTPKRALRMDDDELQTPQMSDFGISEHTMCLNNDFTMELFRKNVEKPQRPPQEIPVPPVMESLHTKAQSLKSPEPPVFYTPGFKIKKTNGQCSPPVQSNGDPESPGRPGNLPTTPEVPVFHSPHMNQLVSTRKSAQKINMQVDDDDAPTLDLPSTRNRATGSKRPWEYDVPQITFAGVEDEQMPEMPNLESVLGNSLQTRSAKMKKKTMEHKVATKEPAVNNLELDGPTQEFSLGTPRIRMDYQEPSTPEVPDLSSVTQDICKLVSQARVKKTATAVVHPNVRPETNKNRAVSLSVVSESEFQSLPKYMKQMTLLNLNQVVHNINKFTEESRGEQTEFLMEELRNICFVGAETPVYILCLTEVKRLQQLSGARNTSVYKLCTHN
ncbi:LOW QUALITY PROTEIN: spindle and kinetochore-associated protein 3 [Sebastes umbrosus]|uniref:LOW QUALITY PROTEIN: spindle and kinetochore-associated protein 3 n=1 Tax=Sebastes umbrosus TaxID=72105 RepID=UPI00189FC756|nr:LOW QUALITY PROTEIN: spindle and kinetochore-associated protein 3 [Sebastes umbrosus]